MKDFLVSVVVWTYNHVEFIEQAIQGIVDQKRDFAIEVIVGDDFSTDGARNKLISLAESYPYIRLIFPDSNKGGAENVIQTLSACRGKYIAFLDGDDYWSDPLKLTKQIDFLECNPEFNLCFHNVQIIGDVRASNTAYPPLRKKYIDCYDFLSGDYAHTNSVVVRNTRNLFAPVINRQVVGGDSILFLLPLLNGGYGYFLPEVMSVYRVHSGGIYSTKSIDSRYRQNEKEYIQLLTFLRSDYRLAKYSSYLMKKHSIITLEYAVALAAAGRIFRAIYFHSKYLVLCVIQLNYKPMFYPYYVFLKSRGLLLKKTLRFLVANLVRAKQ